MKRVEGAPGAPDGEVSGLLHDTVREGDELLLSAPFGDVFLDDPVDAATPVVLVSAGIGGAPMTGVLAHLAALRSTRPVLVLHADRSPADHALGTETRDLVRQLPNARAVFWYERPGPDEPDGRTGLMNVSETRIPDDATVFLCGPMPFMQEVRGQLLGAGVPARSIRYKVFGPDLWLADSAA